MIFFKKKKDEFIEELSALKKENEELREEVDALIEENNAMRSKMDYVEELISECERLQKEWEDRVIEAKTARDNYANLIKFMSKSNE